MIITNNFRLLRWKIVGRIIEMLKPRKIEKINGEWRDGNKKAWWYIELDDGKYFEELELYYALWRAVEYKYKLESEVNI